MKREEKILEPMFPRLHVNDADKGGGPRAPPRNKMALYEQLTIPSQRFTDHGSLPRNTNTLFPSNQPCGVERNLSPQHLDSSASSHVTQTSFMENVTTTLAHRRHQRKTLREEDDFAVPVYTNNSSRRFGRTKSGTKKEKRTTLVTEELDLEKSASSFERVNDYNASFRQESRSRLDRDMDETHNGVESHDNLNEIDNVGGHCRSGKYVSMQHINEEACDDDLMGSSLSSVVDVSPDEVVGVLGQKRFWRARKAIADQQRIFAVQLFELHRLIKVQRLIASSSDVLLDEISYLGKVSAKSFPVKKLIVKSLLPHATKHRSSDSDKTDQHKMECSAENVVGKLSNQPSNHMPFATNQAAVNGCYYPPQPQPQPQPPPSSGGNQQWLIPVMSPSEGLIYKPHPGPGHTGPAYGGYYGHFMPAPMVMGNGYFPPYGIMPTMMNSYGSGQQQQQPNEQINQFVHPGNLQYASSVNTQQQSSVNEEISQQQPTKSYPRARKSRQRSIGSSPSGPEGDDDNNEPEQMMTTTTTTTRTTVTQTTRDGGGVTRVIKVVPHNAKLASENAARIFRSIQEERKHYDSFSNHS
ncbi:unnamed protein product [Eruca vesicaria subsp. sativa]|uniref:Uncharacterized protein n=1 Tax=Eruca vesicaria subsp. sativa TaxID=29727 RepID=A0ABC8JW81_ERUVS|nr:unnamed protein product [Eruca vesicaria subsp. sativa]